MNMVYKNVTPTCGYHEQFLVQQKQNRSTDDILRLGVYLYNFSGEIYIILQYLNMVYQNVTPTSGSRDCFFVSWKSRSVSQQQNRFQIFGVYLYNFSDEILIIKLYVNMVYENVMPRCGSRLVLVPSNSRSASQQQNRSTDDIYGLGDYLYIF